MADCRLSAQYSTYYLDYGDGLLSKVLARPPHLIVACGEFIRRRIEGVQENQPNRSATITTIRNAVDTEKFRPGDRESAKVRLGVDPQRPLLLVVANLAAHKGQSTAIKSVGSLVAEGLRPCLWLVGEERDSSSSYTTRPAFTVVRAWMSLIMCGLARIPGVIVPESLQAADTLSFFPPRLRAYPL